MKTRTYQRDLAHRTREVYGSKGGKAVAEKAFGKLGNLLFRRNAALWYGRELVSLPSQGKAEVPGTFSPIEPDELARWLLESKELEWAADPRELRVASRRRHGWTCWRLCGEIAAFCKIGHGSVFIVDFEREVSVPERVSFLSDVYVVKAMRRRGIARRLLLDTMDLLRVKSFVAMGSHVPADNLTSIRLFNSLGFRPFGEVRFTRVMGLPLFSTRPETVLKRMSEPETRVEGT
jgi:ribosomal protein S18 acetylase RimI-like enzyme